MSDPYTFDSRSPRFGLPLLFSGQAQKEAHVNEAHALTDGLMHCAIEATAEDPPVSPEDGKAWLIGSNPTGEWIDHAGQLALRQGGNWLFVSPSPGMRVFDRSVASFTHYDNGWQIPAEITEPTGGSTVDPQARTAISDLIAALRVAGIFPAI